jgi:hypothetical protein
MIQNRFSAVAIFAMLITISVALAVGYENIHQQLSSVSYTAVHTVLTFGSLANSGCCATKVRCERINTFCRVAREAANDRLASIRWASSSVWEARRAVPHLNRFRRLRAVSQVGRSGKRLTSEA